MEYARIEIKLVRKGWARPIRLPGAVPGPAFDVEIDPASLRLVATTVSPRRMRQLGMSPGAGATDPNAIRVAASTLLAGVRGPLGRVTQLWVDRAGDRHVLLGEPLLHGDDQEGDAPVEGLSGVAVKTLPLR